jgi:tetratricopeptide (TPR) repeat protein
MTVPVPPPLIELTARLARYPADRYPVQHATASFHLGFALTEAGRFIDAERALAVAAELFDPDRMPAEHAKALNARGAALRAAGLPDAAAGCFERACAVFAALGQPLEHGAALFNLGLAHRDLGEDPIEDFRRAREQLDRDRVPVHAAAAARELGAALLTAGRSAEAVPVLVEAIALADRGADLAGLGAAANTLGLVHLALGASAEAIEVLRSAVGAHPRTVRPDGYAMAKANLALAHERAGDAVRARLAARQALGVPGVPEPICSTAAAVLGRVGDEHGGLLDVLDLEPAEQWPEILREELLRWTEAWPEDRAVEAEALVTGVLDRPATAAELTATWLGGLLEMPPAAMQSLAVDVVTALRARTPEQVERFRSLVARGCARFHIPQMDRLTRMFEDITAQMGGPSSWR